MCPCPFNFVELLLTLDTNVISFAPNKLKKLRKLLKDRRSLYHLYLKTLDYIEKLNEAIPGFRGLLETQDNQIEFNEILRNFNKIALNEPGVELDPLWLKNVSISSFTHVEYIVMDKLHHKITFDEIFSKEFLSLLLLINSSVFFLIATENRFVCRDNAIQVINSSKIKAIFQRNTKHKMKKMRRYRFSEQIHLKAIQILKNFFKETCLLSKHLNISFIKNYENTNPLESIGKSFS
jgi:hypothetical protein